MSVQSLSYTSVTRVNSAFPMITSVSNITSGVVAQYSDDAEAEIDARISARYALPLGVTCPILVAIATRETIYNIATQRGLVQFPPAQQGRAPLYQRHLDDQKLLEAIADGSVQLVTSSGAVIAADTSQKQIYSTTMDYVPTFSEGSQVDQVQDQDKLDDDLTNRGLT